MRPLLLAVILAAVAAPGAGAAMNSAGFVYKGAGLEHTGREVSIAVTATNVATDPATTPELISGIVLTANSFRFNGNSDSVVTCKAKLPRNGDAAGCPKSSKVGHGTISAILGTPGQPADTFGVLSSVTGKFTLFNYAHPRGTPARMVAVITTAKPFAGISINLVVPVSRSGEVTINVPTLAKLPRLIRNSYPKDTKLVLAKLFAEIDAPRRRHSNPFLWLRTPGALDLAMDTIAG